MSKNGRGQIEALMAQIEEMWRHQDALFNTITEKSEWGHKHGPDWTFSDVPYHLAYCNRDLVARAVDCGRDLPAEERMAFNSPGRPNRLWNRRWPSCRHHGRRSGASLPD
jgi:hypothetical protein